MLFPAKICEATESPAFYDDGQALKSLWKGSEKFVSTNSTQHVLGGADSKLIRTFQEKRASYILKKPFLSVLTPPGFLWILYIGLELLFVWNTMELYMTT